MKINVHAGHSLKCRGAKKYLDEVTEDRKVKTEVIRLLKSNGDTVYDCTDDSGATQNANLSAIVKKCNAHKVDLDVSIHLNAGGGTGIEVYCYDTGTKLYATHICDKISKSLGIKNRGVKYDKGLYVLKNTKAPALLIECCFVDSTTDRDKWNATLCAKAIVEGILNKTITEDKPSESKTTFLVKVNGIAKGDTLNIREKPDANAQKTGSLKFDDPCKYTIVEVKNGWGKLKSGSGWINLYYTKKV